VRNVMAYGNRLMLAVDPGGTTGWLLFRPVEDPEQLTGYGIDPLEWGEERNQLAFLNRVWSLTTQRSLDGIVIEGWWPRPGIRTWEPEAVEIIGTCRWMMADDPARFYVQKVADATSYGTPEKINSYRRNRSAPFNVGRGGEGHAVKALQHAVLWVGTRWMPGTQP
jgi:hypothetical protein